MLAPCEYDVINCPFIKSDFRLYKRYKFITQNGLDDNFYPQKVCFVLIVKRI